MKEIITQNEKHTHIYITLKYNIINDSVTLESNQQLTLFPNSNLKYITKSFCLHKQLQMKFTSSCASNITQSKLFVTCFSNILINLLPMCRALFQELQQQNDCVLQLPVSETQINSLYKTDHIHTMITLLPGLKYSQIQVF